MKLKRRLLMLTLAATMLFSIATVAYADSVHSVVETVFSKKYNLYVTGYVNYDTKGRDEIYYMGVLNGGEDEMDYFYKKNDNIHIKPMDEDEVLATIHLYHDYRVQYMRSKYISGDYASLEVSSYDNVKTLVDRDGN